MEDNEVGTPNYWSGKSELEKAIIVGIYGPPELRKSERRQFLDEFQERVIISISKTEVMSSKINIGVAKAVKDPRAKTVVVHGDIPFEHAKKYYKLAKDNNLKFTMRHDPSFTGEVGLVVVSDRAIT